MQQINAKNINYGLIALTAFLIPLYQPLVRYAIGLLVLSTFFNFRKPSKSELLSLVPILFYFIWLVTGMLWTDNDSSGWKEVEHSLSFVLFPFVFGFTKINIREYISRIFSFFTFGVLASMIICWILAAYKFIITGDLKFFYYAELSFFHHPTYMAMYGSISLIYLYLSVLNREQIKTFYFKTSLSKFALISVISIFILMLMSKAGILIMLIINMIGIIAVFKSKQKLKQAFLILFGLSMIVAGSYLAIKPLQNRVNEAWVALSTDGDSESSTGARLLVWEASWNIIREQAVLGVGTGDLSDQLDSIYKEKNYEKLLEKSLNSHNQFLETWAKNGIIGLISLLLLFFFSFSNIQDKFYLFFILLIWTNMLMESMLEIQSGIVFIAFMNSMFAASIFRKTI